MHTTRFLAATAAAALSLSLSAGLVACSKPAPLVQLSTPIAAVTDMDISAGVKTALLRDDLTKSFDVIVFSRKGDVRMSGVMDTQAQVDQALALTRAVQGVRTVNAELSVKR